MRIRITKDHSAENGFLFWRGETFEVKTAGEYVAIPAEHCEVIED